MSGGPPDDPDRAQPYKRNNRAERTAIQIFLRDERLRGRARRCPPGWGPARPPAGRTPAVAPAAPARNGKALPQGVHVGAVAAHPEIQVRTGGQAGGADVADHLLLADAGSRTDPAGETRQVQVVGLVASGVVDDHHAPGGVVEGGALDRAVGHGPHRGARGSRVVDGVVRLDDSGDRVQAPRSVAATDAGEAQRGAQEGGAQRLALGVVIGGARSFGNGEPLHHPSGGRDVAGGQNAPGADLPVLDELLLHHQGKGIVRLGFVGEVDLPGEDVDEGHRQGVGGAEVVHGREEGRGYPPGDPDHRRFHQDLLPRHLPGVRLALDGEHLQGALVVDHGNHRTVGPVVDGEGLPRAALAQVGRFAQGLYQAQHLPGVHPARTTGRRCSSPAGRRRWRPGRSRAGAGGGEAAAGGTGGTGLEGYSTDSSPAAPTAPRERRRRPGGFQRSPHGAAGRSGSAGADNASGRPCA